jgi:hypothetical protein
MNASARVWQTASAQEVLDGAGVVWFVPAILGQLLFAAYIFVHYWASAAVGDFVKWNKTLIHPLMAGNAVGNGFIVMHITLALIITVGGPVQVVLGWLATREGTSRLPARLRGRLLRVHRWVGRSYVVTAALISAGAIWLTSTQRPLLFHAGPTPSIAAAAASDTNGTLIVVCALLAIGYARAGKIDAHRHWALLTFLMVSGVWFIRIGYGFWTVATGRPPFGGGAPGTTSDMDGWFDMFIVFARFIVPWIVLEFYFYARRTADSRVKMFAAGTLAAAAVVVSVGTVGAARLMWLPNMLTPR